MQVLGKYTPVDLSIRVTKGQNPSKHAEYMQVLKTLFSANEKHCYWLDLARGTLRYKEWQEVMRCLRGAYQSGDKYPCQCGH